MSRERSQSLTVEQFWHLPGSGCNRELVDGQIIDLMLTGGLHGAIAGRVGMLLLQCARDTGCGFVSAKAGYILARNPDTVRGPDVSFVRADRLPPSGIPEGFWEIAPDLAVEVVSPSESAADIREKVRDFLQAGTPLVWTVYPRTREVIVEREEGIAQTCSAEDVLEFPEVLPGFRCTVKELFG